MATTVPFSLVGLFDPFLFFEISNLFPLTEAASYSPKWTKLFHFLPPGPTPPLLFKATHHSPLRGAHMMALDTSFLASHQSLLDWDQLSFGASGFHDIISSGQSSLLSFSPLLCHKFQNLPIWHEGLHWMLPLFFLYGILFFLSFFWLFQVHTRYQIYFAC